MNKKTAVGQVRPSQLIYSYGVGSIIDLPKMSVIVTGLEDWITNPEYVKEILEERLLYAVRYHHPKVKQLLAPPFIPDESLPSNPFNSAAKIGVPVATFPRWLVCPQFDYWRRLIQAYLS